MAKYKIIRFKRYGDNEVIKRGLTLDEAQKHCSDETTHSDTDGDGNVWFDGYSEE